MGKLHVYVGQIMIGKMENVNHAIPKNVQVQTQYVLNAIVQKAQPVTLKKADVFVKKEEYIQVVSPLNAQQILIATKEMQSVIMVFAYALIQIKSIQIVRQKLQNVQQILIA